MSLKYIFGTINSNNTKQCIDEILANDVDNQPILYLVPEQFSMESQRSLLTAKDSSISMNIRVFGFKHFAYYMFTKFGLGNRALLDQIGKSALLKKVTFELQRKNDKTLYYQRVLGSQGFIDRLSDCITEFMQYGVSSKMLSDFSNSLENQEVGEDFKSKIKAISLIYSQYTSYLENNYISNDGILDELASIINSKDCPEFVCNAKVWINAFKSFTPQELKIIYALLRKSKEVTVSLTVDKAQLGYKINFMDPYHDVKNTVNQLSRFAEGNKISVSKIEIPEEFGNKKPDLEFLAQNYFDYSKTYEGKPESIDIVSAPNKYGEIENLCYRIKDLIMNHNYHFSDIAVIVGDSTYNVPLAHGLKKYDLPNFLDGRISVISHILPEFILSGLEILITNWSLNSTLRYIKTGLVPRLSDYSISVLENYLLRQGIDYSWEEPWKYGFNNRDEGYRNEILGYRALVLESIKPLSVLKPSKKYTVTEISTVIFNFLEEGKTIARYTRNENPDNPKEHELNIQIWKSVVDVFEKLVDILGDEKLDIKEFSEILSSALSTSSAGMVPPVQDSIVIGDIIRTRLPKVKALFVLGANEGKIPTAWSDNGLIQEIEKEAMTRLSNDEIKTAPTVISKASQDQLGIFLAITKPTEYLCISYSCDEVLASANSGLSPSILVTRLQSLFPYYEKNITENIPLELEKGQSDLDSFNARIPAFQHIIHLLSLGKTLSEKEESMLGYFSKTEPFASQIKEMSKTVEPPKIERLSEAALDLLFPEGNESATNFSVTRFEQFSSCPFSFFNRYELESQQRQEYKLHSMDYGNIFHHIAECFFNYGYKTLQEENLAEIGCEFPQVILTSENDLDKLEMEFKDYKDTFINAYNSQRGKILTKIEGYVQDYIETIDKDNFERSSREGASLERIKTISADYILASIIQLKNSNFEPFDCEVTFGNGTLPYISYELPLENGKTKTMNFNGKIDRVDVYKGEDGNAYIKIVDYKSREDDSTTPKAHNTLQPDRLQGMLSLQLPTYMDSFIKFMKEKQQDSNAFNISGSKETISKYNQLIESSSSIEPAAMLYSEIHRPINNKSSHFTNLGNKISRYYGQSGIYREDMLKALDSRYEEGATNSKGTVTNKDSNVYNLQISPVNSSTRCSYDYTPEAYNSLLKENDDFLKTLGKGILEGNIALEPYTYEGKTACDYCAYSVVCKRDLRDIKYRDISQTSDTENSNEE